MVSAQTALTSVLLCQPADVCVTYDPKAHTVADKKEFANVNKDLPLMVEPVSYALLWFWDVILAKLQINARNAILFIISKFLTIYVSVMMDLLSIINHVKEKHYLFMKMDDRGSDF